MISNRIKVSKEATDKMKQLKTKLKAGPMYSIARLGLMFSLSEEKPPQKEFYKEDGMDFNRITLFGDDDPVYIASIREFGLYTKPTEDSPSSLVEDLKAKDATSYLVAHINRGVSKLHNRIKNQDDLYELIKQQNI